MLNGSWIPSLLPSSTKTKSLVTKFLLATHQCLYIFLSFERICGGLRTNEIRNLWHCTKIRFSIKPFLANVPILHPLKTLESKRYKIETSARNVLRIFFSKREHYFRELGLFLFTKEIPNNNIYFLQNVKNIQEHASVIYMLLKDFCMVEMFSYRVIFVHLLMWLTLFCIVTDIGKPYFILHVKSKWEKTLKNVCFRLIPWILWTVSWIFPA